MSFASPHPPDDMPKAPAEENVVVMEYRIKRLDGSLVSDAAMRHLPGCRGLGK